ncbi:hypothetical protein N0V88_008169 [Collariella sp. IMI 366227]|nr:hypothetical protein N0V88_008169 [Collariella sp. IMI 366227]
MSNASTLASPPGEHYPEVIFPAGNSDFRAIRNRCAKACREFNNTPDDADPEERTQKWLDIVRPSRNRDDDHAAAVTHDQTFANPSLKARTPFVKPPVYIDYGVRLHEAVGLRNRLPVRMQTPGRRWELGNGKGERVWGGCGWAAWAGGGIMAVCVGVEAGFAGVAAGEEGCEEEEECVDQLDCAERERLLSLGLDYRDLDMGLADLTARRGYSSGLSFANRRELLADRVPLESERVARGVLLQRQLRQRPRRQSMRRFEVEAIVVTTVAIALLLVFFMAGVYLGTSRLSGAVGGFGGE